MTDRLLRLKEVELEVGLRKSAIYDAIAEGTFPRQLRISRRAVAWRSSDIEKWKAARPQVEA